MIGQMAKNRDYTANGKSRNDEREAGGIMDNEGMFGDCDGYRVGGT